MADSQVASGLTVQQWDDEFFTEYFQENRFSKEFGTSENSIIQVKEDLTKKKGDSVTFALVNRLTGSATENRDTLEGNEEDMDSRSFKLTVAQRRHAVRVSEYDEQLSAIPLRNAARSVLMDWAQEDTRDRIIEALGSINGVAFSSATEAQKDAWLDDNNDRVLFGALKSNTDSAGGTVAYDFSDSLAAIDNTADKFDTGAASLMKRMALTANPKIKPIRSTTTGRRYYVCYVPTRVFRDLKADTVLTNAQRDVALRMQNEKLFQGGDMEWDGLIFKEIDDIAVVSNGTIDCAPVYLCGAQALGYGIASRWATRERDFDYGDKHGVAIREFGNFAKLTFGTGTGDTDDLKDHGVFTGWFAAVDDS